MTRYEVDIIATLPLLFAHAIALELESAECYREMADALEVHNNPATARLVRWLAALSAAHAREVRQQASGIALPTIPPWELQWATPPGPESPGPEAANYLMDRCAALEMAIVIEERARGFYRAIAEASPNPAVRAQAAAMAEEEAEHLALIEQWIANEDCDGLLIVDLDPPNIPE
jgi:rubrerythrin